MTPNIAPSYDFLDFDESRNHNNHLNTPVTPLGTTHTHYDVESTFDHVSFAIDHPSAAASFNVTTSTNSDVFVPSPSLASPLPPPTATRAHSMATRASHGIHKPIDRLNLHTNMISSL